MTKVLQPQSAPARSGRNPSLDKGAASSSCYWLQLPVDKLFETVSGIVDFAEISGNYK